MSNASRRPWIVACLAMLLGSVAVATDDQTLQKGEMAGYLLVPHDKVKATYNAGFSL